MGIYVAEILQKLNLKFSFLPYSNNVIYCFCCNVKSAGKTILILISPPQIPTLNNLPHVDNAAWLTETAKQKWNKGLCKHPPFHQSNFYNNEAKIR